MDVYGYGDNLMNPWTLHVNRVLFKLVEDLMVWSGCSWRDMGPLIRLGTTLMGDRYVIILSDHPHPFMSIVHTDGLGEILQDNAKP
ncbi:transposable element Tcb1 transposase [Trichonephila clavipes]|nr:transposable element Tcb1 transposase [Trichonephila clavipes]